MLKLDKHLQRQMNDFHGSYMDFIYKVNEVLEHNIALKDKNGELVREHVVLEHNNIKTSHYKDASVIFCKFHGNETLNGGNGLKAQFELNNNLFWVAFDMLNEIDGQDKHLYYHLQTVLKRIYKKIFDRLIYPEYKEQI